MKPIIETDRLILRDIDPEADFEPWFEMMADEWTTRYIGGVAMDRALAWRNMAMIIGHRQIRGYSFMTVVEKATGKFVGRIGPWNPEGWVQPEVGWAVHPAMGRQGFGFEAAKACVDYAFNTLGWDEVAHVIHHENIPSMKTAEKVGSSRAQTLDGIPGVTTEKCYLYKQSRQQ